MPQERLTKDQRREAARELARIERQKQKRRDRRNRVFLIGGSTVAVLVVFLVVTLVIINATKPAGPGPANMASDGILLIGNDDGVTTAVENNGVPADGEPTPTDTSVLEASLNIVTYIDYFCPYCNQFETTNAEQIEELVASGIASLEVHPIAILDRVSLGTRYSSRSANAAACVANFEPNSFLDFTTAMYASQPEEETVGLTNDEIIDIVVGAGIESEDVNTCISDETYKDWVTAATDRALADPDLQDESGDFGTPRVLVNGQIYTGAVDDATEFQSFLSQVYSEIPADDATATPTPTPTTE